MIAAVSLVVFGPAKLPEMGRTLGKAFREFKQATQSISEEVTKAATEDISAAVRVSEPAQPNRSPAPAAVAPTATVAAESTDKQA